MHNLNNLMIKNNDYDISEETQKELNDKITKIAKSELSKNISLEKDNIDLAKKLVKLLNKKRASNYNDWIIVGWTLYNISSKLYQEFVDFSKLDTSKFDIESCKKVWMQCEIRENRSKSINRICSEVVMDYRCNDIRLAKLLYF